MFIVSFDFFGLFISVQSTEIKLFVYEPLLFLEFFFELVYSLDLEVIEIAFEVFDATVEDVLDSVALALFGCVQIGVALVLAVLALDQLCVIAG